MGKRLSLLFVCSLLIGVNLAVAQDWPQWRGPNRDNKVVGFTAPKTWPKELTKKWQTTVGIGEASPVLVGGKVYTFTRQGKDEVTTCLNAVSGAILWQDKYEAPPVTGAAVGMGGLGPGPRSTPAVAEGKICTHGVGGFVSCLDAATGKVVWRKDTKARPTFYTRSSPLIVDGMCILFGGNKSALNAYDLATGEIKWAWAGDTAGYGSPVLMTVEGTRQIVTPSNSRLVGVALADGKLLWEVKLPVSTYFATYGTPIIDGQSVIYFAPSKATGTALAWNIVQKDAGFAAIEQWKKESPVPSEFNSPVLRDGLLYGSASSRGYFCMDAKTGEVLWTDKASRGAGGAILNCGETLLGFGKDSQLFAFRPSAKGYEELAKYKLPGQPTGAIPIVSGNRIFVRDQSTLTLWTIE